MLDFLRTTYVGRAAPPVEENWDSDEEEEERAVAAAGVGEEEEEPGGSDPRAPGIGVRCVFSFVRRMMGGACVFCLSLGRQLLVRVTNFLGRDLRISLLGCWAAATGPSGRQTGYGLCSSPP